MPNIPPTTTDHSSTGFTGVEEPAVVVEELAVVVEGLQWSWRRLQWWWRRSTVRPIMCFARPTTSSLPPNPSGPPPSASGPPPSVPPSVSPSVSPSVPIKLLDIFCSSPVNVCFTSDFLSDLLWHQNTPNDTTQPITRVAMAGIEPLSAVNRNSFFSSGGGGGGGVQTLSATLWPSWIR